jgi:hypothetical protein
VDVEELGAAPPLPPFLVNSIVALNRAAAGSDCSGPVLSAGFSIEGRTSCELSGPGDLQDTDPLLGPLRDNGGPTKTLALGRRSDARDHVPTTELGCRGVDQRGVSRPQGRACDVGAFELKLH